MSIYAELEKFKANLPPWAKVGEAEKAKREKAAHKRKMDAMLMQEAVEKSEAKAQKTLYRKEPGPQFHPHMSWRERRAYLDEWEPKAFRDVLPRARALARAEGWDQARFDAYFWGEHSKVATMHKKARTKLLNLPQKLQAVGDFCLR